MSNATASLEKENLQTTCNGIADKVELKFGKYSATESVERIKQLKKFIWGCVDFKRKLECQGNFFCFWWSPPGVAIREERMKNVARTCSANGKVRCTLWPMLFKQMPDAWVVLAKEIVIASEGCLKGMETPSSIQSESPANSHSSIDKDIA